MVNGCVPCTVHLKVAVDSFRSERRLGTTCTDGAALSRELLLVLKFMLFWCHSVQSSFQENINITNHFLCLGKEKGRVFDATNNNLRRVSIILHLLYRWYAVKMTSECICLV